jgi:hypothetical protein
MVCSCLAPPRHPSQLTTCLAALGVSPLLLRVQQPAVPEGGPAAAHHGVRVPHVPVRRARREPVRVSERSAHCHQVRRSVPASSCLFIMARPGAMNAD